MIYNSVEEMKSKLILGIFSKENDFFNITDGIGISKGPFVLRPLLIADNEGKENSSFYVVGKEIIQTFNMSEDEIITIAKQNSMEKYPGEMKALTDFISITERVMVPDGVIIPQIYVITNSNLCCGAAAMFYQPELLANLAELTKKDLAVFPADLNCVYCVPVSNAEQLREYQDMYRVAIEDTEHVLSIEVLHYDATNKQLKQLDGVAIDLAQEQNNMRMRMHGGR